MSPPATTERDTLWQGIDVEAADVEAALRRLEAERLRRGEGGAGRALNLVVVLDVDYAGEVRRRLEQVGRNAASRTLLLRVSPRRRTVDAAVAVLGAGERRPDGTAPPLRETVLLDVGEAHRGRLPTIVDPLVITDVPTLLWAPHGDVEALVALAPLAQAVLFDADDAAVGADVQEGLETARRLAAAGLAVVDLAWLRTRPFRLRLAGAYDPPAGRRAQRAITSVVVRHRADTVAAARLLVGWLASRLGWAADGDGVLRDARGEAVDVRLEAVEARVRGLQGVSVTDGSGAVLALDRARGGLRSSLSRPGEEARRWTVLGASRGEDGLVAAALRRSLLSDEGYDAALRAAATMPR